jgi:multidrug efflux pump
VRLPQYFIDRPIFATVLSAMLLLVGGLSLFRLPISEYPQVIPPTIAITAVYPGANPETVATTVASPLEQQMVGVPGMLYMQSQSNLDGLMTLTLTFGIGADLDEILVDVQNRIQRATPRLPEEVRRLGVTALKVGSNLLMVVHLTSPDDSVDMLTLSNYGRLNVRDRLANVPGVGDARIFGAGEYSMRVWLDPQRMSARGLTPADVTRAIREQNVQIAAGTLSQQPVANDSSHELTVTTQGRLSDPEEFGRIILRRGDQGQLLRLSDVARVELGAAAYTLRSLLNNKQAAAIPIFQAPNSNALETAQLVRDAMADLKRTFPPGIDYSIVYDTTMFVRASIKAVLWTLLEAIVLVVLVVLLFLQTWRASLIPLLAVPVSLIGTFAVMHAMGFSINTLSLFGLVLAIGIVVDDAIVVVENVERNIANGLTPRLATKQAMREVSGPILATALVLCSVFIPTAFISGLTGQFYQQFALTIAISTAISALNSLTLSPALSALLLRPHRTNHRPGGLLLGWFFAIFNRSFAWSSRAYVGITRRVVRFSALALILYGALLGMTWFGFQATPGAFVPDQDKSYLICIAKLPEGASLDRTEAVIREMSDMALKHPAVDGAVAFPGLSPAGFSNAPNFGIIFVRLKPYSQRTTPDMSGKAVAGALFGQFMGIKDAFAFALQPPPILGLGNSKGFQLYLQDRGNVGLPKLFETTMAVIGAASQAKGPDGRPVFDPSGTITYSTMSVPQVRVDVDREKVLAAGLQMSDIADALQGYFGSVYVNDFNKFGRTWQVNVQADAAHRLSTADYAQVKVRNQDGRMLPLASFITVHETAGPDKVIQYNTFPAIDINASQAEGVSQDQAKMVMEGILAQVLPPGVGYEFTGLTYQQILAGNTAIYIFPMCVLLVILVLAAFYESWVLPMAIILIVPMCLLSALFGVWLDGHFFSGQGDNNIMTQIGLIVLVGLACKNAILIVEFAKEAEIYQKKSPMEAALEACRLRLRPILMTSLAFIMGVWPLVAATGAGAELRHATGIAVFSGMIGVTIFGLLLTPVFYVVLRTVIGGKLKHTGDDLQPLTATAPAEQTPVREAPPVPVENH